MKKVILLTGFFVLLGINCLASEDADMFSIYKFKSGSWKSKSTICGMVQEQSIWLKNKKMRVESSMIMGDKKIDTISIIDPHKTYSILPEQKTAYLYSMDNAKNPERSRKDYAQAALKAKKVGSEVVNGAKCDIYEYTSNSEEGTMKARDWRRVKDGFTVKGIIEMHSKDAKSDPGKITVENSDIKTNIDIPDSMFEVPADVKVVDMSQEMQKMKAMQNSDEQSVETGKAQQEKESDDKPAPAAASDEDKGSTTGKVMKGLIKGLW